MDIDIDNKQLERDIENAIRARGLKEQMQQWDAERKQTTSHPRIPATSMPTREEQKPSKWHKLRRTIYSLSAVAVLIGILVMAVPTSVWKSTYRQASRWAYQQYAHYFLPSQPKQPTYEHTIDELLAMAEPTINQIVEDRYELEILGHEDLIQDASWQIKKGNYAVAEQILADARAALSTEDPHYQDAKDDIDYLEALCHLGQNRRTKAKKLLISIAESNSRHREAAAQLAEKVK